jgi:molybdenum cofactor cytidylyltransferase
MGRISAIVLAAGSSRRTGADKLSLPWGDGTVLDAAIRPFVACPEIDEVVVVRASGASALQASRATVLVNEHADEGMGSSLRIGVAGADKHAEAYVLALGDMPELSAELVSKLLASWRASGKGILVPAFEGRRGHPVVMAAKYREALLASSGDVGARRLVAENEGDTVQFDVTDPAVVTDIDTAEGYRALAARRGSR